MASSQGMLVQLLIMLVIAVVMLLLSAAAAPTMAELKNLGCMDHCGSVSIPYPFGQNDKCSRSANFLIACDHSNTQPYLVNYNFNESFVTDISLEGELRIMNFVASDCYDQSGQLSEDKNQMLDLQKFTISNTKNKFTGIGCDTQATVLLSDPGINFAALGCVSQCNTMDYISNGTCSGIGCCQISIPKGVNFLEVFAKSEFNHSHVLNFNPCSFAFIVEESAFNFSMTYLNSRSLEWTKLPMVLDWAIVDNNETCEVAKRNQTTYACGENTDCYEAENVAGYLCKCLAGYQGNPYLSDGCQDIDECVDPNLNQCVLKSKCINTPGNYTCSCPKGYHGDGKTIGTRCIADPNPVIPIMIGLCSGIGALILIISSWWLHKVLKKRNNKKRKEKFFKRNGGLLLKEQLSSIDGSVEKIKLFNSKELKKATDHYNEDRILGQGGQGTVYKGMLSDGRLVAVKKSKIVDEGNVGQFINEVAILSQINNHRNVVKLLGCCLETEAPLVVYEYISNGTLFQHIHDPSEDFPLSWEMRLRIATEVAGALSYLHYAASMPIYHRDIKSTNILLDDKYRAKVANFGISRSVDVDQTHFTTRVQGTFGYLDPEYFQSSQFTGKSDVYSFGVVIVELLTGQKAISSNKSQESKSLATFFIQSLEDNQLFDIIDQKIIKEDWREEIVAVAHLAKRCLNLNGKKRPTMKNVAIELEGIIMMRGITATQQNYEVFEYNRTDLTEAWDVASTSTGTFFDSTVASSCDANPLLLNEP